MVNDARTSLEIRPASAPVWKNHLLSLFIIIVLGVGVAAYFTGKHFAKVDWKGAITTLNALEQEYAGLLDENNRLQQSLEFEKAKSQSDLQIKRQAYDEIAHALQNTSAEIASLRENIRFYESVIEGGDSGQGLQLKKFSMQAGENAGEYHYRVIIINNDYSKKKSRGKLQIGLEGLQQGELVQIGGRGDKTSQTQNLSFKYLQRIEGKLVVPSGFEPLRLLVTVKLTGSKVVEKEKWYDWKSLLNKDSPEQAAMPFRDN